MLGGLEEGRSLVDCFVGAHEAVFDRRQRTVHQSALVMERVAMYTNNRLVCGPSLAGVVGAAIE